MELRKTSFSKTHQNHFLKKQLYERNFLQNVLKKLQQIWISGKKNVTRSQKSNDKQIPPKWM